MFRKMLTGALIAGCAAGLLAALLHFAFIQNIILLGERYEMGELVHFGDVAHGADHATHDNGHGAGHDHGGGLELDDAFTRNALTVAFTILIYVAYAILLTAAFGIAAQFGISIGATQGALWGLGGFVAFQLAPAMGLAPELPGTVAADLGERQVWWWLTVAATALGAIALAYGRNAIALVIGAALLALPHVIGAPVLDEYFGYAPPELGAAFSARVLGVGLITWVTMGWIAGWQWAKQDAA